MRKCFNGVRGIGKAEGAGYNTDSILEYFAYFSINKGLLALADDAMVSSTEMINSTTVVLRLIQMTHKNQL